MKRKLNRIKTNNGSLSLEMVLVTMIMFPIVMSLIIGAYSFYSVSSENTNLNFKAGRFVSTTGCSIAKLQPTMSSSSVFNGYKIIVNEGASSTVIQNGTGGVISVTCNTPSEKGTEFEVYSSMNSGQNVFIKFFPRLTGRKAIYVQEVSG
ncbi:MAG: hypothetical protein Q4B60_05390 [Erysipelotrichaceae bacterium]|nr:hypothetical protein [Erysipelotrichaceae bacterium]